jgi:hypothetical protein
LLRDRRRAHERECGDGECKCPSTSHEFLLLVVPADHRSIRASERPDPTIPYTPSKNASIRAGGEVSAYLHKQYDDHGRIIIADDFLLGASSLADDRLVRGGARQPAVRFASIAGISLHRREQRVRANKRRKERSFPNRRSEAQSN